MTKCRSRRIGAFAGGAGHHEGCTAGITKSCLREIAVLTPWTGRRADFLHRHFPDRRRGIPSDVLHNGGDKAIAAPVYRLDEALLMAAVAQSAPHGPEPLREGVLTDALIGPELFEEFGLGDDAIAVLHEVDEHIEALALESTKGAVMAEFIALRIELVIAKGIDHATAASRYVSSTQSLIKHHDISDT